MSHKCLDTANLASSSTDAIEASPARISHTEFSNLADNEDSDDDRNIQKDYAVVQAKQSEFRARKPELLGSNPLLSVLEAVLGTISQQLYKQPNCCLYRLGGYIITM